MPRLFPLLAFLTVTAAAPAALAQGVLLPPGEVPNASGGVSGADLFSPQPIAPQMTPRQLTPPQPTAPQQIPPSAAPRPATAQPAPSAAPPAPAAQAAPATPPASAPLPQQRPASANQPRPPAAAQAPAAAPTSPRVAPPAQAQQALPQAGQQGQIERASPATIEKLTTYWNSVQTLVGTFVQVDADGTRKTGDFYMQKPGRVRFEYNPPTQIQLISNGQNVAVRDRRLNTQDLTPLNQTPLRFILAERIDLTRNSNVLGVYQDNLYIQVIMQESVPMMGTYRLQILFDAKDFQLRQWTVTDPQGYDTSVAIYDLNYTQRPDPSLFVIN
ncbi:LolA family protein [Azorhizobium caulinodans]|nr:outer-membrane lipoprotein carrier protein LolA [Azorhizobium caulinodans]